MKLNRSLAILSAAIILFSFLFLRCSTEQDEFLVDSVDEYSKDRGEEEDGSTFTLWEKLLGTVDHEDTAYQVLATSDGNYVVVGTIDDYGEFWDIVSEGLFEWAFEYIAKLSPSGEIIWENIYSGTGWVRSAVETTSGDIVTVGNYQATCYGSRLCNNLTITKYNGDNGAMLKREYLGHEHDSRIEDNSEPNSIIETSDGDFVITGKASDWYPVRPYPDVFVYKISSDFEAVRWASYFGGGDPNDIEGGSAVLQTSGGGFIVAGTSCAEELPGHNGGCDVYIVRLNSNGGELWQKLIGGSGHDYGYSIMKIDGSVGQFIVVGESGSNAYVLKISDSGIFGCDLEWEKFIGDSGSTYEAHSVVQMPNGYLIAGYKSRDAWVARLDHFGEFIWESTFGGSDYDIAYSIQKTSDGLFIVAGGSDSEEIGEIEDVGEGDAYVFKFAICDDDADGYYSVHCGGGDDCNDLNPEISPGSPEVCDDELDNDCDGYIDLLDTDCGGCLSGLTKECDTGMVGICSAGTKTCDGGLWGDCVQDVEPSPEICEDGLDNNCDGLTDEEDPYCLCLDLDQDGYGGDDCGGADCNDNNPAIHPGAEEICKNGIDENCNGMLDDRFCALEAKVIPKIREEAVQELQVDKPDVGADPKIRRRQDI